MLENENVIGNENVNENVIKEDNGDDNVYPMKIYVDYQGLKKPQTLTQEQNELIDQNANYLSKHIWFWNEKDNNYKFNLPKTIFSQASTTIKIGENYSNNNDIKYLNPQDENGSSLRKEHLEQIWQRGEFCVESTEPNLPYKWKLSKLTVKGILNNIKSLKTCLSFSFGMLYLIKYRFIGEGNYKHSGMFFSSILFALFEFILFIIDIMIGIPSYYKRENLIIKVIKHNDLIQFLNSNPGVKLLIFCADLYKGLLEMTKNFLRQVWPKINSENTEKFYKEGLTTNEIEQRLYVLQKEEYLNYLYTQDKFVDLDNKYKCLDLLKAQQIINNKEHEYTIERQRLLKEFDLQLQKKSIQYEVAPWKKDQIKSFEDELTKRLTSQKNEQIAKEIAEYTEAHLIFNKNASFNNNYNILYKQAEALAEKYPNHSAKIIRKCIRPYKIIQTKQNKSVSLINNQHHDVKIHYEFQKSTSFEVQSNYYGWRLFLYFMRFLIYTWNIAVFSLKMVFYSCVSIQALFRVTLYTDDQIDYNSGEIYKTRQTYTYPRTLCNLMQWISSSRKHFEEQPDRGIFGKNFTRIFNLIWNYIIKLFIFGLVVLICYPILIVISAVFFLLCFCISPLLSLAFVILELICYLLLFDGITKKFFPLIRNVVWMFLIRFLLFFIANVCLVIVQPIAAVFGTIFGIIVFVLRYIYDFMMYYLVKCIEKIPVVDTCFAWKVEGPGLFRNRFYNLPDADILLLLRGQLENDQLTYYNRNTIKQLEQPERDLKDSIKAVYDYFYLDIKQSPPSISKSITFYKSKLSKLILQRETQLPKFDKNLQVRFTRSRLSHVKELIKKYIIEFEKENGLEASIVLNYIKEHDDKYEKLVKSYLVRIFGSDIMETLEENDEIVYLESKASKFIGVIDVIGNKLLDDPNYKTEVIKEKNKKQNETEYISRPNIATFQDVFNEKGDLFLDLKLLTDEEQKQYLGTDYDNIHNI